MTGPSRKLAIASSLSQAMQPLPAGRPCELVQPESELDKDAGLAAIAQAEYGARRRRDQLFNANIFAEPAWDMLLDLFVQRHQRRPVSVQSLCIAAAVPQTTALRWIGKLDRRGLVDRTPCTIDNRVIHVSLSDTGLALMEEYLRGQLGEDASCERPTISFS